MPYIELHARSAFSFLEGASLPENLIATAAERGLPAMALLDRHGVYGAPRFHMAAKQHKIKAHVGAEVSIAEGGNYPLLVATRAGYQNLCRLITTTKLRTPKKSIAAAALAELQIGSQYCRRWKLSATGCNSRWLSKPLPPDHHYEITHSEKKHRGRCPRGIARSCPRTDLSYRDRNPRSSASR